MLDYPIQQFTFSIFGIDELLRKEIINSLSQFKNQNWVIAPPQLIEDIENISVIEIYLDVYSAHGTNLPKELDQAHYHEVCIILKWLQEISFLFKVNIDCHLEQNFIGSISNGLQDELLSEGLLEEWKRQLL